ncbi:hypothetical protein ASA1KI_40340 [Opitutales bacterium ASA1]|nr:hypothetical protein ASA1KI_40340 [Opitutales bacterium ASA1]
MARLDLQHSHKGLNPLRASDAPTKKPRHTAEHRYEGVMFCGMYQRERVGNKDVDQDAVIRGDETREREDGAFEASARRVEEPGATWSVPR